MDISEQATIIKYIRQQHDLTSQQIAEMAGVPIRIPYLMEIGCPVDDDEAKKVMRALSILSSNRSELPESRITYDSLND